MDELNFAALLSQQQGSVTATYM